MRQALIINGTASIGDASWDVKITDIKALEKALNDEGVAGDLIAKDIKRKVHIK